MNPDPTQEIEGYVTREVFYIIKLRLVQVQNRILRLLSHQSFTTILFPRALALSIKDSLLLSQSQNSISCRQHLFFFPDLAFSQRRRSLESFARVTEIISLGTKLIYFSVVLGYPRKPKSWTKADIAHKPHQIRASQLTYMKFKNILSFINCSKPPFFGGKIRKLDKSRFGWENLKIHKS